MYTTCHRLNDAAWCWIRTSSQLKLDVVSKLADVQLDTCSRNQPEACEGKERWSVEKLKSWQTKLDVGAGTFLLCERSSVCVATPGRLGNTRRNGRRGRKQTEARWAKATTLTHALARYSSHQPSGICNGMNMRMGELS